jgi:hypothetical protein
VELVHVRLTTADLVSGDFVVLPHARAGLARPLLVGDSVVVTDQDGEFHSATVVAVGGDGGNPEYHLRVGARLPLDLAAQRMTGVDTDPENAGIHEVVDLLGELRGIFPHTDNG